MEATLLGRPHAFERGDKVYLTTPLVLAHPDERQIEEYAFASAIKTKAPNENLGWLQGRYVEADRANLNGAMWLGEEIALRSLTPMLMPVTVMHDPRTAVGTIADCKLLSETGSTRLETILAIWRHRFPTIWEEAGQNIELGQMMQSMECFSPWYTCSECEQAFVKLPGGAEKASWCGHLRGDDSSAGKGWRILRDTCFTGTGLIFGSRGGVGAYTEAHLDHFQDEIAEYHAKAHVDSTYRPNRSTSHMGLIQIEESELATLRTERNDARTEADRLKTENRDLTTKVETAEAAKVKVEGERDDQKKRADGLEEQAQKSTLQKSRMEALGNGFLGKLGEFTRSRLTELAGKLSDEEWDLALKEREEMAGVARDLKADASGKSPEKGGDNGNTPSTESTGFKDEEVASFLHQNSGSGGTPPGGTAVPDGGASVRKLARAFSPKKTPAGSAS